MSQLDSGRGQRKHDARETGPEARGSLLDDPVAPMINRSQEAFRRDLPELLKNRYGQWVAYHAEERIGFGGTQTELYEECFRRGLERDEFVVRNIQPEMIDEVEATYDV